MFSVTELGNGRIRTNLGNLACLLLLYHTTSCKKELGKGCQFPESSSEKTLLPMSYRHLKQGTFRVSSTPTYYSPGYSLCRTCEWLFLRRRAPSHGFKQTTSNKHFFYVASFVLPGKQDPGSTRKVIHKSFASSKTSLVSSPSNLLK